jgi:hypothetical protein
MLPLFDGSLTTKEVISKGMPRFTEKGGGEEEELSDLIVEMATQELMPFIRKLRENKVLCSLPNC